VGSNESVQVLPRPKFAHVPRGRPQIASCSLVVEQAARPPLVDIDAYGVPHRGPQGMAWIARAGFWPSPLRDCERIRPERRRRAGRALPSGAAHARLGCRFGCATWVAGSCPLPELAAQRRRQLAQADHDLCQLCHCTGQRDKSHACAHRLLPLRALVAPAPGRRGWGTRQAEGTASSRHTRARPCLAAVHGLREAQRQCALAARQVRSVLRAPCAIPGLPFRRWPAGLRRTRGGIAPGRSRPATNAGAEAIRRAKERAGPSSLAGCAGRPRRGQAGPCSASM